MWNESDIIYMIRGVPILQYSIWPQTLTLCIHFQTDEKRNMYKLKFKDGIDHEAFPKDIYKGAVLILNKCCGKCM